MSYQNLGYIAVKRFQYARAEEYFRAAIELAPAEIAPRTNLMALLQQQGQWEKATAEVTILTRMQPHNLNFAMNLATCYQNLGRIDYARTIYGMGDKGTSAPSSITSWQGAISTSRHR